MLRGGLVGKVILGGTLSRRSIGVREIDTRWLRRGGSSKVDRVVVYLHMPVFMHCSTVFRGSASDEIIDVKDEFTRSRIREVYAL
jgi:hypothetical protein